MLTEARKSLCMGYVCGFDILLVLKGRRFLQRQTKIDSIDACPESYGEKTSKSGFF